ncbi:MAG: hypothetical protein H8E31_00895 [Planctomycetes bacterium]|nr:hypothetical protein [Planctomycetota bacterium]
MEPDRRLLLPALLLLAAGCATQDRVRTIGDWNRTRSDGTVTEEKSVIGDFAASRSLNSVWELRGTDRSQLSDQSVTAPNGVTSSGTQETHQPRLTLTGLSDLWEAEFSADRAQSDSRSGASSTDSVRDTLFSRLVYRPDGLPTLTLQADRIETSAGGVSGLTDLRRIARLEHTIDSFSVFVERYDRLETVESTGEEQHQVEDRFGLNGSYQSEEGALTASGSLSWSEQSRTQRGTPGDFGQLPLADGLYALDSTPTLGGLDSVGGLIDNNRAAGAGIQIGGVAAGGGVDRNIGLDQGLVPRGVDRILLYTDVAFTASEAAQFNWSLYVSNDNLSWSRTQFNAISDYEVARQRFVIQTGGIASRYIKVVNTSYSATAPAVEVSEIRALGRDGGLEDGTVARRTRADGSLVLSPTDDLRVYLEAGLGVNTQDQDGITTSDETVRRVSVGASYSPLDWMSASVRASDEDRDDALNERRVRRSYSEFLGFVLNPRWNLDFSANQVGEDLDGVQRLKSDSISARSTASLIHDIAATLSATQSSSYDFESARDTSSRIIGVSTHAPIRQDMELRLNHERTSVDTEEGGARTEVESESSGAGLTWYPTDAFSFRAELDWVPKSVGPTGISQAYLVNWQPLSGGELVFQFSLNRRQGTALSGASQSSLAQVRWRLRQRAYLDLTAIWSEQASSTGEPSRAQSTALTLSVDF